ncbi:hypothetical protein [Demequina zhanjiangensis]|uniref:Lipoprotein n=1 Tax=Demequina zhanjiangensis TaxID=3051659 RepID=A0ABT8FYY2_9MICO|nr:hypothetical protein [Demequina sp. SYSU T00b26]MDN4472110.1 hypothetical protein [Demequina sp. SYSU T00b26]
MRERSGAATWWAVGVVAVMVAVAGCSAAASEQTPSAEASATAATAGREGLGPTAEPSVAAADGSGQLATSFDDTELSTTVVDLAVVGGVDVVPGLYRAVGDIEADPGNNGALFDRSCKWGLYEGAERGLENIVMARGTDGGHPVMRIAEGQRAYTQWCGAWELVDEANPPTEFPDTFDDGYWVVGLDIAPGTYEGTAVPDPDDVDTWCGWTVWSTFEVEAEGVDYELVMEATTSTATVQEGQVLTSDVCGPWVRVE